MNDDSGKMVECTNEKCSAVSPLSGRDIGSICWRCGEGKYVISSVTLDEERERARISMMNMVRFSVSTRNL